MKAPDEDLPEQVPGPENLRAAWLAAKADRGAAGVDGIRSPDESSFPGFTIGVDGEVGASAKSAERHKAGARAFRDGRNAQPLRERKPDWQRCVRGWRRYFRPCGERRTMERPSKRTRRHMRKAIWLRRHNRRGRLKALRRLGATGGALRLAHSGRGAWRVAPALNGVPANARLRAWRLPAPTDFVNAPL